MSRLVITRHTRDGKNTVIIDDKLKCVVTQARAGQCKLLFEDIGKSKTKVRRQEVPEEPENKQEYILRKATENES